MPKILPEKIEFCGACGVILPILEERTLAAHSPEPNEEGDLENLIYKCDNCDTPTDRAKPVAGYFDPAEAARLRCL